MTSWFLSVIKMILPIMPSFWIAASLLSLIYPQYNRYQQDVEMKQTATELIGKINRKVQKQKIQDAIQTGSVGSKDLFLNAVQNYRLQKMRLMRLQKNQNHLALQQQEQLQMQIEEISNNNRLKLQCKQNQPFAYQIQLIQPSKLEEADVLFLLHILNQPNIEVVRFSFEKIQEFDQEVFLLKQMEISIYETKA